MSRDFPEPSPDLLAGRRVLDGVHGVELLQDLEWNQRVGRWVLHCQIATDVPTGSIVPAVTRWYVVIDPNYPQGQIKVYPDREGGLDRTFQHQNYNGAGGDLPWRAGDLCLATSVRILGRQGYDPEPRSEHERLAWHLKRAAEWLKTASSDQLSVPGEPFELPQYPNIGSDITVAFSEDSQSFQSWQANSDPVGLVDLSTFPTNENILVTTCFRTLHRDPLVEPTWGSYVDRQISPVIGVWIRLSGCPVLPAWQAPMSWTELRQALSNLGTDLLSVMSLLAPRLRDGKPHVLLFGFPIPEVAGDEPIQMHWQAVLLPIVSYGTLVLNGFRPGEPGYWYRDKTEVLRGPVTWLESENWHADQISTRGRMDEMLTGKKVLVVGGGAIGSVVAELLVRGGVADVVTLDSERLEIGNLSRHSLSMDDIKQPKAVGLEKKLNSISPHAAVMGLNHSFPPGGEDASARVQQCQVIIDCTGSDDVLYHLERFPWQEEKLFLSVSIGLNAKRLYCFAATGRQFPASEFARRIEPWLERDLLDNSGKPLPREGIGCWHPVFPARADDIWLLSAAATKQIEDFVARWPSSPELAVFEQQSEGFKFTGLHRVNSEALIVE